MLVLQFRTNLGSTLKNGLSNTSTAVTNIKVIRRNLKFFPASFGQAAHSAILATTRDNQKHIIEILEDGKVHESKTNVISISKGKTTSTILIQDTLWRTQNRGLNVNEELSLREVTDHMQKCFDKKGSYNVSLFNKDKRNVCHDGTQCVIDLTKSTIPLAETSDVEAKKRDDTDMSGSINTLSW